MSCENEKEALFHSGDWLWKATLSPLRAHDPFDHHQRCFYVEQNGGNDGFTRSEVRNCFKSDWRHWPFSRWARRILRGLPNEGIGDNKESNLNFLSYLPIWISRLLKVSSDCKNIDSDIERIESQCVATSLSHQKKIILVKGLWFSVHERSSTFFRST